MSRIGYFADGPWAHQALVRMLDDPSISIAFICARNDNPDPVLRQKAASQGIDFVVHPNINGDEFFERVAVYECDLFVSMSFNQIFKARMIDLPKLGTINCHAGKLPFYRGRNILNWVLITAEDEFGITVHHVDEGIDTGDIILQRTFPITDDDTYATLLERAYAGCAEVLYEAIKALQAGGADRTAQRDIHTTGFYCVVRREGDEWLDWDQPARDVFNFVRAISQPGPEARTFLGETEVRIGRVQWMPDAPVYRGVPGSVLGVGDGGFLVKTKDSFVKVMEWSGIPRVRNGDRFR